MSKPNRINKLKRKKSLRYSNRITCAGKEGFGSKWEALERLNTLRKLRYWNKNDTRGMNVYRCANCGKWHIGHTRPTRKQRTWAQMEKGRGYANYRTRHVPGLLGDSD